MKTYKITLHFTNPYIGSRNGGDRTIDEGLSLKDAQRLLLRYYNEKYFVERGDVMTWGAAVNRDKPFSEGANKTYNDGTRSFDWDSRIYRIEEEEKQTGRYKAYIAGNEHTQAFDFAYGETAKSAMAAVKRKNSPDWKDCVVWWVVELEDGSEVRMEDII